MKDNSLKKLIDLAKGQGNKFFVLDESGEPVLVMMSVDEYEKLLVQKLSKQVSDIEQINREILEAQKTPEADEKELHRKQQEDLRSEVMDANFSFDPIDGDI